MLPYPCGEDQGVKAAQSGDHRGDTPPQPVQVDAHRKDGILVAVLLCRKHRTHVGVAGEAEKPRAVPQRGVDLARR